MLILVRALEHQLQQYLMFDDHHQRHRCRQPMNTWNRVVYPNKNSTIIALLVLSKSKSAKKSFDHIPQRRQDRWRFRNLTEQLVFLVITLCRNRSCLG